MTVKEEINHPDINWAKLQFAKKMPTETEIATLWWDGLCGCYMMNWRGMWLGLEKDGHIHS